MTPPFLLDTSALFAHCLDEPGADTVETILQEFPGEVGISVMTWLEFQIRLEEIHPIGEARQEIVACYAGLLDEPEPVTKAVAGAACDLRRLARHRIPNADALIAATAQLAGATLVHRDPHLAAIPQNVVRQIVLPHRQTPVAFEPAPHPHRRRKKA